MTNGQNRIRILSIDGGGMRGLYTASYLSSLAQRFATARGVSHLDIGKGFDLIIGTSTGAIIACALAAGISLGRVSDLYRRRGPEIFPRKLPSRIGPKLLWQMWRRTRYLRDGALALENALHKELGDITLGDIWRDREIALAIPAIEMSRHHSWVFKTPHLPNTTHRDDGYRLVDVCLAATAAPIYRSMTRLDAPDTFGSHVFVDGGLWANNPVLVSLVDALGMTQPGERIEIFCLGTCPRPGGELVDSDNLYRGLSDWQFGGGVVNLAISAQGFAFDNMARMIGCHLDRDCKIVRFPHGNIPAGIMKYLDLDETSSEAMDALVGQANADVNETLALCRDTGDPNPRLLRSLLNDLPTKGAAA